jgi:hypothetical protein
MAGEMAERTMALAPTVAASRPLAMRQVLEEQQEIRSILKEYIGQNMVSEIDFGVIPGTVNPTLLQPGAEKLAEIFRCVPEYEVTTRTEQWETGLFHYEFFCKLIHRDSGAVIAEGMGSCNSREGRYWWRNASRKCPSCGKEAIIKGKEEYGGGWLCWKKKDGCGATFEENDAGIIDQKAGKVANEDIASCVNTVLKMAKKRALVDASIVLARKYGFNFTQDMEDQRDHDEQAPPKQQPKKEVAKPNITTAKADSAAKIAAGRAAAAMGIDSLRRWWKALGADGQSKALKALMDSELKPLAAQADAKPPMPAEERGDAWEPSEGEVDEAGPIPAAK